MLSSGLQENCHWKVSKAFYLKNGAFANLDFFGRADLSVLFCLLVYFALCIVHTGFSSHFRVCFISLHGFKVPAAGSDKTRAFWDLAADEFGAGVPSGGLCHGLWRWEGLMKAFFFGGHCYYYTSNYYYKVFQSFSKFFKVFKILKIVEIPGKLWKFQKIHGIF